MLNFHFFRWRPSRPDLGYQALRGLPGHHIASSCRLQVPPTGPAGGQAVSWKRRPVQVSGNRTTPEVPRKVYM